MKIVLTDVICKFFPPFNLLNIYKNSITTSVTILLDNRLDKTKIRCFHVVVHFLEAVQRHVTKNRQKT